MFTNTFTLDRHIEELRAELRGAIDIQEAEAIRAELDALLLVRDALLREMGAAT
jgi:hypothetical protein